MKTIKASLKLNKNGRLFCTLHQTYKVSLAPKNTCRICWTLFESAHKQSVIDKAIEALDEALKGIPK